MEEALNSITFQEVQQALVKIDSTAAGSLEHFDALVDLRMEWEEIGERVLSGEIITERPA